MDTGYGMVYNAILYNKELTDKQKILFCCISSLCAKEGYCWATNKYFADKLLVKENTISVNISRLNELGFVLVVIEDGFKRKISLPPLWIKQKGGIEKITGGGIEKSTHNNTIDNTINNKTNEQQVAQEGSHKNYFFGFRQRYPLKKSKKKAESIYQSLMKNTKDPGNLHKMILEGLEKYRKEIEFKTKQLAKIGQKFNSHFIKHPTTRLTQGCREDEYEYENKQTVIKTSQKIIASEIPEEKPMTPEQQKKSQEILKRTQNAILSKSKPKPECEQNAT